MKMLHTMITTHMYYVLYSTVVYMDIDILLFKHSLYYTHKTLHTTSCKVCWCTPGIKWWTSKNICFYSMSLKCKATRLGKWKWELWKVTFMLYCQHVSIESYHARKCMHGGDEKYSQWNAHHIYSVSYICILFINASRAEINRR